MKNSDRSLGAVLTALKSIPFLRVLTSAGHSVPHHVAKIARVVSYRLSAVLLYINLLFGIK